MIVVWDDHEITNDTWKLGAQNHSPDEGSFYDRKNNTYVFSIDLKADMTVILEWDDLPEHARVYIMHKAGKELQENMISVVDNKA